MHDVKEETKSILVVDDEWAICKMLDSLLTREGFDVISIRNPEETLKLVKEDSSYSFDLIILDLMMPGFSGYSVIKELQQEGYQKIPIMVLTARDMDPGTIEIICNEPNVCGLWKKPVNLKEFRKSVRTILFRNPIRYEGEFQEQPEQSDKSFYGMSS